MKTGFEPQVGLLKQDEKGTIHAVEGWKFIQLFSTGFICTRWLAGSFPATVAMNQKAYGIPMVQ